MVISNSTPNNTRQQSHKHNELILNTSAINSDELNRLLELNEEIEQRRAQRHSLTGDGSGLLKATMTREELFEISTLDDDNFLTALEHQNSYSMASPTTPAAGSRVQVTDLDLSSIENLMKYFNEDVPVTPTKASCEGKVANVIATFKSKAAEQPAIKCDKPTMAAKQMLSGKVKINELKQKYESKQAEERLTSPPPVKPRAVTKLPMMKVKEMAQLFNSKINQVMRRTVDSPQRYEPLKNEYSPEQPPTRRAPPPPSPKPAPRYKPVSYRLPGLPSPVPSPRQRRRMAASRRHEPCLVAEEVFRELSVKDKALLFNKFVGEMSAKHPKFNAHAAVLQEQIKKQMARGEVVAEQQASVADLARELEAKCQLNSSSPPRPALGRSTSLSPRALQSADSCNDNNSSCSSHNRTHVSTLTVVLKPSPEPVAKRRSLPQMQAGRRVAVAAEAAQKRNLSAIRCAMPTEAYAPPKKIRKTRAERPNIEPKMFFQNEQLESLFYNWLREENGVLFDITSISNAEQTIEIAIEDESTGTVDLTQKSAVERLLEEAIAKLEESKSIKEAACVEEKEIDTAHSLSTQEHTPSQQSEAPTPSTATPVDTPIEGSPRKVKRQAPPVPAPRPSLQTQSCSSSVTSSCKQSDAESESGMSTLPKITSDESQPEMQKPPETAAALADFEFAKPQRPPRKKKMRRTLTWKKENCIIEATTAVTSTDSDSDYKKTALHAHTPHVKKRAPAVPSSIPPTVSSLVPTELSYIELDKSLMRHVNSPRKIKCAYTLTVLSSPSPPNGCSDQLETPRPSLDMASQKGTQIEPRTLIDSFIDQGFETGSNEADPQSPMRPLATLRSSAKQLQNASSPSPLFCSVSEFMGRLSASPRPTLDSVGGKPNCFSTPVKLQSGSGLNNAQEKVGVKQQLFGQRRDSRRSSLAMQVIREDLPLDMDKARLDSAPATPSSYTASESAFFANAPTVDMPSRLDDMPSTMTKPVSMFWISFGDFTVSLEVFYNPADRLRLLYEIFTQKSCENRDFSFGIDGHKFMLNEEPQTKNPTVNRWPSNKGCSHYWFASGDLAVPFSGKHLTSEKIQRLFKFIAEELSQSPDNELRFGVDSIDFSSVPEFWHNSPKFSIENSMLVGLQTGNSNGLEGRSKYSWPNSNAANVIKTSDLDHSEFESDTFSNNGRLSFSPEMFSVDYEHVPLDELFDNRTSSTPTAGNTTNVVKGNVLPQMMETLQQQQSKLKTVEQRIRNFTKPGGMSYSSPEQCRNTPEYVNTMLSIIQAIEEIGRDNGYSNCSLEQLESFMYIMSDLANHCLTNCSENMDRILDTLLERRSSAV